MIYKQERKETKTMNMKTTMIALAALAMSGTVYANDSSERVPGLTKAIFTGSEFDTTSDVYANAIARVNWPEEMYSSDLPEKTTVAWAGYMKMESGVKYTFKGCYDDYVAVKINGQWIVSKGSECQERSGTFTPAATGWYPVEFRVGNNGGPGGCQSSTYYGIVWNTSTDAKWRNVFNGSVENVIVGGDFETVKNDTIPCNDSFFEFLKPNGVEVTNIKCQQRYPWNGMVDIDYTVTSDDPNADVWVYPIGYDKDSNTSMAPRALMGDGVNAPVKAGTHRMTWTVTEDYPDFHSTAFTVKMIALVGAAPYMVVDLSGGVDAISYPVSYLSSVPEGGWGDEYKTTKLVLRLIPPGSFMMGSPSDESGRQPGFSGNYTRGGSTSYPESMHPVVLTKPFYIGIFEITQKQYQLVMGENPAYQKGDKRPVEKVSYNNIRGNVNGAGWPTHNQVDANSFMGRLRSKVNMLFDLPSEAQWEYACRAGTSSAFNVGSVAATELGRCYDNRNDGKGGYNGYHTSVGSYMPNTWGLYDMHGNVWEYCRDFIGTYPAGAVMDPKGYTSGARVIRGGGAPDWLGANVCRSATRAYFDGGTSGNSQSVGFRVFCSPVAE